MDPDLPLIEALQAGDESALNELINRHREPLFYFVYRYLRDEMAARDVVQETFVRVFFKARTFRPRSSVKTWIYTIALNLTRDEGRRLGRRQGRYGLRQIAQNVREQGIVEMHANGLAHTRLAGAVKVERNPGFIEMRVEARRFLESPDIELVLIFERHFGLVGDGLAHGTCLGWRLRLDSAPAPAGL